MEGHMRLRRPLPFFLRGSSKGRNMNKEIWQKPLKATDVGGEALIEGVMMRGNGKMAVAVRMPNGTIDLEVSDYVPAAKRSRWFRTPFVRGAVSFVESMVVGVRVLLNSAEKLEEPAAAEPADMKPNDKPQQEEDKFDKFMRKVLGENYFQYMLYFSVAIALVLGIGLFMLLPNFLIDLLKFDKSGATGSFYANMLEGAVRLILFVSYIYLVSRNKEIKRVFQYHGAEHKSIYALENNEPLTVENARRHTTLHPRCGTAFLFVVMIISIFIFMFVGWHSRIVNLLLRLVLLPVIAGVSYEVFKAAARTDFKPMRALTMPGLMLQKITTQEPDDEMLEVALTALRAVVGPEVSQMPVPVPEANPTVESDEAVDNESDETADSDEAVESNEAVDSDEAADNESDESAGGKTAESVDEITAETAVEEGENRP